jgi:hypothetical protein
MIAFLTGMPARTSGAEIDDPHNPVVMSVRGDQAE